MKRILLKDFVALPGVPLAQGAFVRFNREDFTVLSACPIGTQYIHKHESDRGRLSPKDFFDGLSLKIGDWAIKEYGKPYVRGFVSGFDEVLSFAAVSDFGRLQLEEQGYRDGVAIRGKLYHINKSITSPPCDLSRSELDKKGVVVCSTF